MHARDVSGKLMPAIAAVGLVALVAYRVHATRERERAREASPEAPAASTVQLSVGVDPEAPFELDGTHIRVRKPDGAYATDAELVGAVLVARDGGVSRAYRIDGVEPDPLDTSGEVVLYALSTQDASGAWTNACSPDAHGLRRGFPIAGVWSESGAHLPSPGRFEMTCTSGAYGDCVRRGYRPWKGREMWDRHQACTRLERADYCGDGVAHTSDGASLEVDDVAHADAAHTKPLEAAWGVDGAVCVRRPRGRGSFSLDQIRKSCPARLDRLLGDACTEDAARRDPRALLLSKS